MVRSKLKSTKAESLLETLVAVLIGVLSVMLLSTSVMVAARLNKATDEADSKYDAELKEAEMLSDLDAENMKVTFIFEGGITEDVNVDIYGTGDFASYQKGGDAS